MTLIINATILVYLILCLMQSVVEPMLWGARLFSGQKSDMINTKMREKNHLCISMRLCYY